MVFLFVAFSSMGQISPEKVLAAKKHNVWCVAYSDDGKYIASGGDDGSIVIYNTSTYEEVSRFAGLKDVPVSVCFSHDSKKLAAAGKDMKVTVWDFASKNLLFEAKGHKGYIIKIEFSPNDKLIASASYDKTIKLWDAGTGELKSTFEGHTKEVNSLSFSPNGEQLVSGSGDKTIKIWNVANSSLFLNIPAHTNWVRSVAYSPDGSLIASGGDDRQIHLWDAVSGVKINTFLGHKNWVSALGFSPDGNYIISGDQDNILILSDIRTGKMIFQSDKQSNKIMAIAFNPTGKNFAFAALLDPNLQVWDASMLNIKPLTQKGALQASSQSGMLPKVSWINPTTNITSNEASLMVKASISSESSLRKIEMYVNNTLFNSKDRAELMLETAENNTTHYEELVILNKGENTIQLKAVNIAGEALSKELIVNYTDVKVELMSWIQPDVPIKEVNNQQFEVIATINKAGVPQEVTVLLNGKAAGTHPVASIGGLIQQPIPLVAGKNEIQIRVKTSLYTKETETRIVNYVPALRPEIVWLNPLVDATSFMSSVNVKGTINSKIPIEKVEVQVNGVAAFTKTLSSETTFVLEENIQVVAGKNTLKIVAKNKVGETVSQPKVITYQAPEKTFISWITPASNTEFYVPSIELKACIQSKSDVSSVKVFNNEVLVHSAENPAVNKAGECALELNKIVTLNQGLNAFKIEAVNLAGVTSSELLKVSYIVPQLSAINWIEPNVGQTSTTDKNVKLKACISSSTPILTIDIIANSQIISNQPEQQNAQGECRVDFEQLISLNSGNNTIMLKVKNSAGEALSQPLFIDQKSANPYRFALIIGNEDYSSYQTGIGSESNVDFAINDAQKIREMCINKLGIHDEKIVYLENARQMEMIRSVNKINLLIKASEGKAEVIVFYAGHGFPDEKTKEPFLIPVDVSGSDLDFGGGIKLTKFYELLTEHPSQKITVFLDACFSGGARNQGLIAARGVKIVPKETKEAVKKNLIVFAASSGNETSLPYKEKKQGMFTYFLLKKIDETNGNVTYLELSDYLKYQVNVNSLLINNKEQQPQTNVSEQVGEEWKTWRFSE